MWIWGGGDGVNGWEYEGNDRYAYWWIIFVELRDEEEGSNSWLVVVVSDVFLSFYSSLSA